MTTAKNGSKHGGKTNSGELQTFVNAREHSAVFIAVSGSLSLSHVVQLQKEIQGSKYEELDMVVQCGGGDIHAAYQIMELLRLHATKLNACVPFFATSAATLLCIGANTIILDELAQLGPLDTQVEERQRGGKKEFVSALNPFKALEQMQKFALETLDLSMKMIVGRSGLDVDECFKHGMEFVRVTAGPLFSQLNPEKLGAYSRALSIGEEYAKRLLMRCSNWDEEKRNAVATRLVHGYPSHDYIIDYRELQDIGFQVELFKEAERKPAQKLVEYFFKEKDVIRLVDCEKPPEKPKEEQKT